MQYHFEGTLTARDAKRYISHLFAVPDECGALNIQFHFTPHRVQEIGNLLTLTLFDPNGFRGAGHRGGNFHQVQISSEQVTPGYIPGPLPAGQWNVQLDTHMIMPGAPVQYRLDITLMEGGGLRQCEMPPVLPAREIPSRGVGWYRGDLHTHTYHSDAAEQSVADLIQAARDYALDFFFLTDHNTIAGLYDRDALAAEDILICAGMELTTFWGHALCLGTRAWVDWRIPPDTDAMACIAAATYTDAQLFVIAHPQSPGDPGCTGCAWRYGGMMPGNARLVEVWNGPWAGDSNNAASLALWYDWLNQGIRLVATAGTDTHGGEMDPDTVKPGFNVIYAESLSEAALLDALRAGHLYLSSGPQLAFQARDERGKTWMMGDSVTQPVMFTVTWTECPPDASLRLIVNGRLMQAWQTETRGTYSWPMTPDMAHWVSVEVRDTSGELLALTNPIFF
ncbi:MAG: PHP domain-containing protein [Anaerolineae bacterium]|nr:PHP domain-containing protein [Anaerolineae bacterium]